MAHLVIRSGKHAGKKLRLPQDDDVVFGRDESCQVRLGSGDVSRRHCVVQCRSEGVFVRDLGSRNGTHVNDVQIEGETLLQPGDTLRVGPAIFQVPGVKAATATDQAARKPASDDVIASWLSEDEPERDPAEDTSAGDTTIISKRRGDEPEPPGQDPQSDAPSSGSRKKFESVAEEAADIFRRWRESQGHEPPSRD